MIPTLDQVPDGLATRHGRYADAHIRATLRATRTIALVGASANPARPSWIVLKYLLDRGYVVTPVNPGLAGQTLLGRPVAASLAELGEPVDMVEIFRNSAAAGSRVVALEAGPNFDPQAFAFDETLADEIYWTDERLSGGS
ncbi:hypothetical protein FV222_26870, partial [Methylobacterium sp. WL103]|uniref:CoA-binding protein n=1 Tax=Methylobacterium sp. WL103 TaxID=2603891 RepID=UPI0011D9F0B0